MNLNFAGIETIAQQIDINGMTHFNFNAWSADFTQLRVKLVDFGADAAFGGGDDTEHELTFDAPEQGSWLTYNISLDDFVNLVNRDHIAQLIISSNGTSTVFLDNVYFSNETVVVDEPMTAAPDPTLPQDQVISLFSGVYTNVPVDTWLTPWSAAALEDIQIQGNDTKKYVNLNFAGIETIAQQIDINGMTHFNFNAWSADFTQLRIKLVDFGADAAFGGGDDTEHELTFDAPEQGAWLTYNIILDDFVNLANRDHIAQLIISSNGTSTVFLDNVYFSNETVVVDEPMTAAPNPTLPQDQVISLFSGVYTNVPVDTWLTPWSAAALEDIQIQGNDTKKYVNLNFAGIETIAQQIDINGMTHFNFNAWSADFTQLRVKLVDFGADAAFGGGDDTEHELTFDAPEQGAWLTYNINLDDFVNLANRDHIAQLIISSNGNSTVYIDNVYFSTTEVSSVNTFNKNAFVVYPNPAADMVSVKGNTTIDTITVYNTLGQQVMQTNPKADTAVLNVASLTSGVYIISTTSGKAVSTQKFIKQ
jgi:hypothetical protein